MPKNISGKVPYRFVTCEVLQCEKNVVIVGARSGLYGGFIKTSQPIFQRFWRVTTCVAWRCCPDGTQHLFCWLILANSYQSLALNGPVIDSRDLNLVFGLAEATPNKRFPSSPPKCTVEPSWLLVLVWPPFELLRRNLTTIVFAHYCSM
ncbi:hypothetical protein TNCV_3129191 [Trichonephila clavipes]|nr:hypothetical protein TNCV_3129191 [Trichonephila clavipes]